MCISVRPIINRHSLPHPYTHTPSPIHTHTHTHADNQAALVNNAGIPYTIPLELLPLAELRRVFEVNCVGLVGVTQASVGCVQCIDARSPRTP